MEIGAEQLRPVTELVIICYYLAIIFAHVHSNLSPPSKVRSN